MSQTPGFHLSPVDLDSLPGIADICDGTVPDLLKRELELAITNACDPRYRHDGKRSIKLVLGLRPDADQGSALWCVEGCETRLCAALLPKSGRVVFRKGDDTLQARTLNDGEVEPLPMDDSAPVVLGIPPEALIHGQIDFAFKRASIQLYLDVDDGRKVAAALRTLTIVITVCGDEDGLSTRLKLQPVKTRLGAFKDEDGATQRLYVNRKGRKLVAGLEPDAHLPDGDVGHQAAVAGTVVDIREGR